jgi:hypothetical protein
MGKELKALLNGTPPAEETAETPGAAPSSSSES